MKKIFIGVASLLAAAVAVLLCLGFGLPAAERVEDADLAGGALWLAENQYWSSRLYGGDESGRISQVYQEYRRAGGRVTAITQVAVGGRGVYFIRQAYPEGDLNPSDWTLCRLDPETGRAETLGGGRELCRMRVTGLSVAYGQVQVAGVTDARSAALCTLPESGESAQWTLSAQGGGDVLRAAADGDGLTALLRDGRSVRLSGGAELPLEEFPGTEGPGRVSVTFPARVLCKRDALVLSAGCAVALLVAALLIRRVVRARSLTLRTAMAAGGCLLVTMLLAAACLSAVGASLQAGMALNSASVLTQARARLAGGLDPAAVLREDFFGSEAAGGLSRAMAGGDELYALKTEGISVALSRRSPDGTPAERALDALELELVSKAARGENAAVLAQVQGRRLAVCAVPVTSGGIPVAVLLSRSVAEISRDTVASFASSLGIVLAVTFLLALVLLYCFLRRTMRPIRGLTEQMRAVSNGDLSVREMPDRRDELGDMCRTMQEMCMGLSIRDYEVNAVLRSYRRFIPKELDKLLDRASVMEVELGDAKTITGSVGLFSVNNRERARADLEDTGYVEFVSGCFAALRENADTHRGRLLSAGFDLAGMPVFYPEAAADGVQAGLDLMGEQGLRDCAGGVRPDFFLMLHHAPFLYGIAGTQKQTFPFLSSSELEFLGSYAGRFQETGVRMVLTEAFVRELNVGCNTRYIGFVTSEDGRYTYKLYEALDTYPDLERNLRIRYDQRLQEGIRLFYHNDFYLARNMFSALLKACPGDGVVRWYLFACEHFFNSSPEQVDYQLFGIDR